MGSVDAVPPTTLPRGPGRPDLSEVYTGLEQAREGLSRFLKPPPSRMFSNKLECHALYPLGCPKLQSNGLTIPLKAPDPQNLGIAHGASGKSLSGVFAVYLAGESCLAVSQLSADMPAIRLCKSKATKPGSGALETV